MRRQDTNAKRVEMQPVANAWVAKAEGFALFVASRMPEHLQESWSLCRRTMSLPRQQGLFSFDEHTRMAHEIRLLRTGLSHAALGHNERVGRWIWNVSHPTCKELQRTGRHLETLRSRLEDLMYRDYPQNSTTAVYYGPSK